MLTDVVDEKLDFGLMKLIFIFLEVQVELSQFLEDLRNVVAKHQLLILFSYMKCPQNTKY